MNLPHADEFNLIVLCPMRNSNGEWKKVVSNLSIYLLVPIRPFEFIESIDFHIMYFTI